MAKKALIYISIWLILLVSVLFLAGFGRGIALVRTLRSGPSVMDGIYCLGGLLIGLLLYLIVMVLTRAAKKG